MQHKSAKCVGQQIIFVLSAVLIHHLILFSLEAGSSSYWPLVIKSTLITAALSIIILLSAFQLFSRKTMRKNLLFVLVLL